MSVWVSLVYVLINEAFCYSKHVPGFCVPPIFPLVGNLHKLQTNAAEKYRKWAQDYGDSPIRRRKGAASTLNRSSVESYVPQLDLETKDFISEILKYGGARINPINPAPLVQRLSLSFAFTINWGTRISPSFPKHYRQFTRLYPPSSLDIIFIWEAKSGRIPQRRDKYLAKLNGGLDQRIKDGTHNPCIQANVTLNKEAKLSDTEITSISIKMLSAGFETTSAVMTWAICLLATRPDIQQNAITEIQTIYGSCNPLCDAYDDQKCEYIVAFLRECLRCVRDAKVDQQRIWKGVPVGTTIFLNVWACNMDPRLWSDPDKF
ncbi:hypothetical protein VI817_006523 [Penicillium citrinum]|nr:hypothetical protein VI817_006523 [Penicillium citrinum]